MDETFLVLEQGRVSSTALEPSPDTGRRDAVEPHITGLHRLSGLRTDTIWTCSLVLVQSIQLFLNLTARDRQAGGEGQATVFPDVVGDDNGATASVTANIPLKGCLCVDIYTYGAEKKYLPPC